MNAGLIMSTIFTFVILGFILAVTPYLTRRTESFGVSIREGDYGLPVIRRMRKQYVLSTGAACILLAAGYLLLANTVYTSEQQIGVLFSIVIFVALAVHFLIYLHYHREMKKLKETLPLLPEQKEQLVIHTNFRNEKLAYSNLWFLIGFLITAVGMFMTFAFYDRIPERIPMHYDFSGKVTSWAEKSYRSVLLLPVLQMAMTGLFIFVNSIISRAKQQISAENPEKSFKQNVLFRRRWSAFMIMMGNAMVLMFLLIQMSFVFSIDPKIPTVFALAVTVFSVIGVLVLAFLTGQGGSRIKTVEGKTETTIDRDDDRYWKLGMFYFNKEDPALFLEKRFGIGWTNNWAHPLSWILTIGLIAVLVLLPILFS